MIAPILARRDAAGFWLAVVLTGIGTGLGAAALTGLLELVQHTVWPGAGIDLLDAASKTPGWRHVAVLLAAGVLTGGGQWLLVRLPSGNGIDITRRHLVPRRAAAGLADARQRRAVDPDRRHGCLARP